MADARSISWPELVVLMSLGDGPELAISGVVHVRDVQTHDAGVADTPPDAELPGVGPVRITEDWHRVAKRGELVRRERLDGSPLAIFGHRTKWIWLEGAELPTAFPRGAAWGWSDQVVVERPPLRRWEGDDFTHPTGPAEATECLGRLAWSVELAPPAHKPFPLTLLVDAQTGIVLQQRNDGFGSVVEWTEISFGAELPDELFDWTGEVLTPQDRKAEHERQLQQRREWLRGQGVGALSVYIEPEVVLHQWDDVTGAFEATLQCFLSGAVLRRPAGAEPWDTRNDWPYETRWSDGAWDWYLGTRQDLSAGQITDLRRQLGSPE